MPAELLKPTEHVDPSKSSLTEEMIGPLIQQSGNCITHPENGVKFDIYTDSKTGEKFLKIDDYKNPESQKLATLILKGIVNVSDVVKVGNSYYSHFQKLDCVESSKEGDILGELEADILLLELIVGDEDHKILFGESSKNSVFGDSPSSAYTILKDRHNLRVDTNSGKLNFYDLKGNDLIAASYEEESEEKLKKTFQQRIRYHSIRVNVEKRIVMEILTRKVALLSSMYQWVDLEIFKKMVKRSGMRLAESNQEILFNNIKLRIAVLNQVLSESTPV